MESVERETEYKELHEIKTCLVFWSENVDQEIWLKKLSEKLKNVRLKKICYIPAGVDNQPVHGIVVVRNGDLGFGGKVQNEGLRALLEESFDLFIDLSPESNALVNYVGMNARADCKIGMKKDNSGADIMIDEVVDPLVFIDEMEKFLSEIKRY